MLAWVARRFQRHGLLRVSDEAYLMGWLLNLPKVAGDRAPGSGIRGPRRLGVWCMRNQEESGSEYMTDT
jgi:hypothetical protein